MIKRLAPYMKGYTRYAITGSLFMVIEVVCELLMPMFMAKIVDVGITGGKGAAYIARLGAIMVVLACFGMMGGCTNAHHSSVASQGFAAQLREDLFRKIADFSFHNIDTFSTASLTTRLTNDVTAIQNTIMMALRLLIRAPMMLLVAFVFAISINARLSAILLVAIPVIFIGVVVIMRKANQLFQTMQRRIDALNGTVQENLIGVRTVKAYVKEDYEKKKFKAVNDQLMESAIKASGLVVTAMPLMMLVLNACMVAAIWFGGNMVGRGTMETGTLISFISYLLQILMSLMMVSMVLLMLARSKACAKRLVEILDTQIDIPRNETGLDRPKSGCVEFRHVSFRYRASTTGEEVLSDLNFKIPAGSFTAIVGGTGTGKSSLVSLIPRLYDAASGEVLVDGHNVKEYNLTALREEIGVVLQNNTLFSGTIRENLLWGKENATEEELVEAAKAAQAHAFILNQPKGYDTDLGQGGVNLSGGQKQRLCIARAMIKKPKILILDDSTSAVDTATEAAIRRSFLEDWKGTTVFMIAQRISSVEHADQILVLDEGKIAGAGTHETLLASNQIYQEINATQQKGVLS